MPTSSATLSCDRCSYLSFTPLHWLSCRSIGGHFGPVNTVAFAPDGRSFASGGEDGYVRINHLDQEYFEAHNLKVAEANA